MTKGWSALATIYVLWLAALPAAAQLSPRPTPNGSGYGDNYIPEGTRFVVTLSDKLDTSKVESGKRVETRLAEDLIAPNGTVIPRGKKAQGHVSSVDRGMHGRVLISFDRIETNHGWMPLAATVVSLPGEHGAKTTGSEGEIEKQGVSKTRVAEGAVAGAGVGAATGAIAGGGHGAVIGAAVGGAVGGTAGFLTGRNLTLNKGQQLELQLDRPLQVPAR